MTTDRKRQTDSGFYLVSLKHTRTHHRYVSLWGPDNKGYVWPVPWAGVYSAAQIEADPDYYNNGTDTIAVPVALIAALGTLPRLGDIDGNVSPIVRRNPKNMAILRAAAYRAQPKP